MRAPDWFIDEQNQERARFIASDYMAKLLPHERRRELRKFDEWQQQEREVVEGHEDPTDFSEAI